MEEPCGSQRKKLRESTHHYQSMQRGKVEGELKNSHWKLNVFTIFCLGCKID